nr:uncharacterized protein CFP56_47089 [Quercus suber]
MEWVEKNGPWNFDNNLLLLCRWKKGLSAANIVFSHSPFWVQVWGVPFELMSEDTAKDIGNKIGIFLEADKRSWQADQARYMRVRTELPLNKPLRRGGYLMGMEGAKLWVTFKYERLPTVCYICGKLGRDDRHIVATKARQMTEYQYGDWLRAARGYKGGQSVAISRREERQPSSNERGRNNIQPVVAEKVSFEKGGGNKKSEGDKVAEKQAS